MSGEWVLSIDTGGTFTDCLAQHRSGQKKRIKVLSSSALRGSIAERMASERAGECRLRIDTAWRGPDDLVRGFRFRFLGGHDSDRPGQEIHVVDYRAEEALVTLDAQPADEIEIGAPFELLSPEPAPLLAARLVTGTSSSAQLPELTMRLATTRGTNALLTRTGTPPVLFVTRGFGDLLEIGTQARPDLFALRVEKPQPLYASVVEARGRLAADGSEIEELDVAGVASSARELVRRGHRVAAVALLHADKNPQHEKRIADCLEQAGFHHVSCSAQLAPFIKILPRAETAVVNAYLAPVIESYLRQISAALDNGKLLVMTSAGGLVGSSSYRAKDSLLSGPAGGIAGAAQGARAAGFTRVIAFDMGGTSTDVARYDGDFEYTFEHRVGDAHLIAPAMAIESVAAGGGSICSYDGLRLNVGPKSAGASPGPACYGVSGPLTLTDVNLLLGRIDPGRFEIPILPQAAREALDAVRRSLSADLQPEELLEGFLDITNQRMADAIRRISLRQGYDPQEYALVAFGGAGPQHAIAVADRLEMETVLIPPNPGLLSSDGLAGAVVERFAEQQILSPLDKVAQRLPALLEVLGRAAVDKVVREGVSDSADVIIRRRIASLRFAGQDATLEIDLAPPLGQLGRRFEDRYRSVFGHSPEGRGIELVSLRVVASTRPVEEPATVGDAERHEAASDRTDRCLFGGRWQDVPVLERERLRPGAHLVGPCLVFERYSATVIDPGWTVEMDAAGTLVARKTVAQSGDARAVGERARPEAVRLELFTNRLESIAREMGESLRRSAISTNIKERFDFSCALLDAGGELIVNAPHIPVHLGSLGLCVRTVAKTLEMKPGDTVITNHPAFGGSHLPDVTLISPAHDSRGRLLGYVCSRAHHAELGGTLPGSMPPNATCLADEGVVIAPTNLVRDGEADWGTISAILTAPPHPTRALADNLADIRAALAANHSGVTALTRMAQEQGSDAVEHTMTALKDLAEAGVRKALLRLGDGQHEAKEILDDGSALCVRFTIKGDRAELDFSGTSDVHPGNLNATPAVVQSAVLYVLRLLLDDPLPLNEGFMRAVELLLPPGILNPPFPEDATRAPAVVGGNVETSQRLVNAMLRALKVAAASQGTMNNVTFGNETFSYYETICGGCGAGPGFPGADAVHSHMTNTRMTDAEVIEHRHPVRIERFAVRRGSGGAGRYRGGDGVVREIRFLAPMSLSILSQHRSEGPQGLAGGGAGRPGSQRLLAAAGSAENRVLEASDTCLVAPGDLLIIETPGGGGYLPDPAT